MHEELGILVVGFFIFVNYISLTVSPVSHQVFSEDRHNVLIVQFFSRKINDDDHYPNQDHHPHQEKKVQSVLLVIFVIFVILL